MMPDQHVPTDGPEPQPGDFDEELAHLDPDQVHHSPGNRSAGLSLRLTVEGADADKLRRIAHARGQRPSEVVADLLRSA